LNLEALAAKKRYDLGVAKGMIGFLGLKFGRGYGHPALYACDIYVAKTHRNNDAYHRLGEPTKLVEMVGPLWTATKDPKKKRSSHLQTFPQVQD